MSSVDEPSYGFWRNNALSLAFGGLFLATGSLLGPIVAHVAINVTNLRYLRDNDVTPKPRRLGGLLAR